MALLRTFAEAAGPAAYPRSLLLVNFLLDTQSTQLYGCVGGNVLIPEQDSTGNLPPGVHTATWADLEIRFGTDAHRKRLLTGLRMALLSLKAAGCTTVYIDGSFITKNPFPADFDVCWNMTNVDFQTLYLVEPVLFDFRNRRAAQKAKFAGELFPAQDKANSLGQTFLEFFQLDKDTGQPKGIVAVDLGSLQ